MGCTILFTIRYGDKDVVVPMETDLSSGQSTYRAIAEELIKQDGKRQEILKQIKTRTRGRRLTEDDVQKEGIVPNSTVSNIIKRYPKLEWEGVDETIDLLQSDYFEYYGQQLSKCIIDTVDEEGNTRQVIIIDPTDTDQVRQLNNYLLTKAKLRDNSEKVQNIIKDSDIESILSQLPDLVKKMEKYALELKELEKEQKLSPAQEKKYRKLLALTIGYDDLISSIPTDTNSLLVDYMENKDKYSSLRYKDSDGKSRSVSTEIKEVIKQIQGKRVREAIYNDVFANEIVGNSTWDFSKGMLKIPKADFVQALWTKLEDIEDKKAEMKMDSPERNKAVEESTKIRRYLVGSQNPKNTKEIIDFLIKSTDDEFSYSFDSQTGGVIYLRDAPRILENKDPEFYRKVKILKPQPSFRGYNIYLDPTSKKYYFSRHILTSKSYGSDYNTIEECRQAISERIKRDSISHQTLIEFKTRGDRDLVYVPNKYVPGQVIKSLNIKLNLNQPLNSQEEQLIYNSGLKNANNLEAFYNYVSDILNISNAFEKQNALNILKQTIITAEDAACFIYILNEIDTPTRTTIPIEKFNAIINRIKEAKDNNNYEYFVVEEVSDTGFSSFGTGFKKYYRTEYNKGSINRVPLNTFKTVLTKVNSRIHNNIVETNEDVNRLGPSIQILEDVQKAMSRKGITVNIETNASLKEKFEQWGVEEEPLGVRGFVRDGQIYINSSIATQTDLFHEYVHLALAVLKAQNYDNYRSIVDLVANHEKSKYLKGQLREKYKYLAEEDLNEEVFAAQFGNYMAGRSLDSFLNSEFKYASQAVVEGMQSIFGAGSIKEHWDEFKNADISSIIRQFSFDLRLRMNEGNGLEIEQGNVYRQATSWIESQIREHEKAESDESVEDKRIGILKDC